MGGNKVTEKYLIRRAKHSDLITLVKLLTSLFSIEEDFIVDEAKQQSGLTMMLDDCQNRCIMVAELGEQVVGMCTAQILVSTAEGGIVALIEDVVVDYDYRGRGIGRQLLLSIQNWAIERGARRLQLLADQNNTPALMFYKNMGWEQTQLICLRKK